MKTTYQITLKTAYNKDSSVHTKESLEEMIDEIYIDCDSIIYEQAGDGWVNATVYGTTEKNHYEVKLHLLKCGFEPIIVEQE